MPWLNFDATLMLEVSHFKNLRFFNFRALRQKFVLALEPRVSRTNNNHSNNNNNKNSNNNTNNINFDRSKLTLFFLF